MEITKKRSQNRLMYSISDQSDQPPRKKFATRKEDPKNYQPGDRNPSTSDSANSQTDSRNQGVEVGSIAEQNKHID